MVATATATMEEMMKEVPVEVIGQVIKFAHQAEVEYYYLAIMNGGKEPFANYPRLEPDAFTNEVEVRISDFTRYRNSEAFIPGPYRVLMQMVSKDKSKSPLTTYHSFEMSAETASEIEAEFTRKKTGKNESLTLTDPTPEVSGVKPEDDQGIPHHLKTGFDQAKAQIALLQSTEKERINVVNKLREELDRAQSRIRSLEETEKDLTEVTVGLRAELDAAQKAAQSAETSADAATLVSLTTEIDEKRRREADLFNQIIALRNQNSELEGHLDNQRALSKQSSERFHEEITRLDKERDNLDNELRLANSMHVRRIEELNTEIERLKNQQATVSADSGELERLNEENSELKEKLDKTIRLHGEAEEEVSRLQSEVAKHTVTTSSTEMLRSENERLQKRIDDTEKKHKLELDEKGAAIRAASQRPEKAFDRVLAGGIGLILGLLITLGVMHLLANKAGGTDSTGGRDLANIAMSKELVAAHTALSDLSAQAQATKAEMLESMRQGALDASNAIATAKAKVADSTPKVEIGDVEVGDKTKGHINVIGVGNVYNGGEPRYRRSPHAWRGREATREIILSITNHVINTMHQAIIKPGEIVHVVIEDEDLDFAPYPFPGLISHAGDDTYSEMYRHGVQRTKLNEYVGKRRLSFEVEPGVNHPVTLEYVPFKRRWSL